MRRTEYGRGVLGVSSRDDPGLLETPPANPLPRFGVFRSTEDSQGVGEGS